MPYDDQENGIRRIKDVRNALLHGKYERVASQSECSSVPEFFKQKFPSEVEALTRVVNDLMRQNDPATGKTYTKVGGS